MTLEELIGCSADQLEALSDAQLEAILAPYFKVTRPEFAGKTQGTKQVKSVPRKLEDANERAQKEAALNIARKFGFKV